MKTRALFTSIILLVIFISSGFRFESKNFISVHSEKNIGSHTVKVIDQFGNSVDEAQQTEAEFYFVDVHLFGFGNTHTKYPVEKHVEIKFELSEFTKPEVFQLGAFLPMSTVTRKREIDLVQPRHIYASKEGLGHIYMPTSIWTIGAQMLESGYEVNLFDENISHYSGSSSTIGFNLLGAPYLPIVSERIKSLDSEILIGGQVVNGLSSDQIYRIFGEHVFSGNKIEGLKDEFTTSLIPVYKKIPDEVMKMYLEREFSFFVSQGCKFACKFCGAKRTQKNPETGVSTKVTEKYRTLEIMESDLDYLMSKADVLGLTTMKIYMSNLDVFQTPNKLGEFAEMVINVRKSYPKVGLELRALATVDGFLDCLKYESVLSRLCEAGYTTSGFGVDGGTPEVWTKIGKAHNFTRKSDNPAEKSLEAIRISKEHFGITPEVLMVFGHVGVDTEESLKKAVEFTEDMVQLYGALPRPHVSKNLVPGNDHWLNPENKKQVETFVENPWLFQALDFCALATWYTHGDQDFADLVNEYYLRICNIPGNTTLPIKPINFDGKVVEEKDVEEMMVANLGLFDR